MHKVFLYNKNIILVQGKQTHFLSDTLIKRNSNISASLLVNLRNTEQEAKANTKLAYAWQATSPVNKQLSIYGYFITETSKRSNDPVVNTGIVSIAENKKRRVYLCHAGENDDTFTVSSKRNISMIRHSNGEW